MMNICPHCEQEFKILYKSKQDQKFCSRKCFNAYFSRMGFRRGKNNGQWKGGLSNFNGYLMITHGIESGKFEHRKIIENKIGRKLKTNEIVHHKNGNKKDNRLENLEIMTRSEHLKHHYKEIREAYYKLKEKLEEAA